MAWRFADAAVVATFSRSTYGVSLSTQLGEALLVTRDEQTSVLGPRGSDAGSGALLQLDGDLARARVQLDVDVRRAQPPQHAGRVPRRAGRQRVRLEQERLQPSLLELIGHGRAHDAAAEFVYAPDPADPECASMDDPDSYIPDEFLQEAIFRQMRAMKTAIA